MVDSRNEIMNLLSTYQIAFHLIFYKILHLVYKLIKALKIVWWISYHDNIYNSGLKSQHVSLKTLLKLLFVFIILFFKKFTCNNDYNVFIK